MKTLPVQLFLLAAFTACSTVSYAQADQPVPFRDLFTIRVDTAGGETFLRMDPDSTPGDSQLNARCTALYNYHDYLFENYAKVLWKEKELLAILPDTVALRNKFHALLEADTAFRKLYMRTIDQDTVAPLSMDSAFWIAAHFFYLHRMNGRPTAHICVGINKVKEMSGLLRIHTTRPSVSWPYGEWTTPSDFSTRPLDPSGMN
jgi:hypothetical protein